MLRFVRIGTTLAIAAHLMLFEAAGPSSACRAETPGPYQWKSVIAGGGGFVPGIIYHPSAPGLVYARTDMGGAYRWDSGGKHWVPLTDMMDRTNSDYMGILSIALDRNDTNRVYMECGKYTQSWAGTGAVLSSTDRGASWTIHPIGVKIGGNEDGRGAGERLQVDPNLGSILFMGTTRDGLWKSTDRGASWQRVSSFSPTNVNFVLFDPAGGSSGNATQRLFAAAASTGGQSLLRSDDGGGTWTPVPGQPSGVMAIRAALADTLLCITFSNAPGPNGATSGSVWKYGIPGGGWTNISPSSGSYGFSGVTVDAGNPRRFLVSTLDRWSPRDEVYQTTDAGATWSGLITGAAWDRTFAPYTSTITPHWIADVELDPFFPQKAMFVTGYGIWACDDVNASPPTWYFRDELLEETVPLQIVSPPFTALLTAMGDIDGFRHDDPDISPRQGRYNPPKGTTRSLAFAAMVPSKIVKSFDGAPYGSLSTDGGTTWRDFGGRGFTGYPKGASGGNDWSMALSADGGTILWGPTGAPLSFSTDNGKSWSTCAGGVPRLSPVADRVNPEKFYTLDGLAGKLWVSTDGGQSFATGATGLPAVQDTKDGNITAMPGIEGRLWICCGNGGLYRSNNSGLSALKVGSVTSAYRLGVGRAAQSGGPAAVYLQGVVGGALGLFRSDDECLSWTRINDAEHQFGWIHQVSGDPRIYGRCYVSAEGRGSFYGDPLDASYGAGIPSTFKFSAPPADSLRHASESIAVRWGRASDPHGLPLTYLLHLTGPGVDTTVTSTDTSASFTAGAFQPLGSYTLTGWVTNETDTTASSNSLSFPAAALLTALEAGTAREPAPFALRTNYPNPFNPRTVISFTLPEASEVTLRVYDVVGRLVATLLTGARETAGSHEVPFDATRLASGIYMYRLETPTLAATRSMVLIK